MNQQANESLRQYTHIYDLINIHTHLVNILLYHSQQADAPREVLADVEKLAAYILETIREFRIDPIFGGKGV